MATGFAINKPFQTIANLIQKEFLRQSPALQRLKVGPLPIWRFLTLKEYKIQLEPANFFPVNAERIREFYNGTFAFGNRVIRCNNLSPFQVKAPSVSFERELQSFSWLNDLSAAKSKIANQFAISMVESWLDNSKYQISSIAWQPDIVATRLISWLTNCKLLLSEKNPAFTKKFYKSLNFQYRYLYTASRTLAENEKKLLAYTSLYFATLCLDICNKQKAHIEQKLELCLKRQIFPDGGHISRNPQIMIDLVLHFLSLRYSFNYVEKPIIRELHNAIERMIPAIRMFIHKDGTIARFNGVGHILSEKLDTIFTLDKTKGEAFSFAPHSGYQRLEAGDTVIIADIGAVNNIISSHNTTASCLAFELSSGKNSFIVNTGIDNFAKTDNEFLGRSTAANSTASINDLSSYNFIALKNKSNNILVSNKLNVEVEQIKGPQHNGFVARHDGYKDICNLLHERKILLSNNGNIIQAVDNFLPATSKKTKLKGSDQAIIRFHIHPSIELSYNSIGNICLNAPKGDKWCFSCAHITPQIEDSIFFAQAQKPTMCKQIVLKFCPSLYPKINWMLQKI